MRIYKYGQYRVIWWKDEYINEMAALYPKTIGYKLSMLMDGSYEVRHATTLIARADTEAECKCAAVAHSKGEYDWWFE